MSLFDDLKAALNQAIESERKNAGAVKSGAFFVANDSSKASKTLAPDTENLQQSGENQRIINRKYSKE